MQRGFDGDGDRVVAGGVRGVEDHADDGARDGGEDL
jgi:hypothetical protein